MGLDKKTHYSAKELHQVAGCQKFKNYQHLVAGTRNDHYIDRGEFPLVLKSYSTLQTFRHDKAIDCTLYHYLNKVHIDIGFGDTIAVGALDTT